MTTYLATKWTADPDDASEEFTESYCSDSCRFVDQTWLERIYRDDDSYEFDETCANCGKLVPAAEASIAELMYANDVLMEGFVILRPAPILYDADHASRPSGNGTAGDEP